MIKILTNLKFVMKEGRKFYTKNKVSVSESQRQREDKSRRLVEY